MQHLLVQPLKVLLNFSNSFYNSFGRGANASDKIVFTRRFLIRKYMLHVLCVQVSQLSGIDKKSHDYFLILFF